MANQNAVKDDNNTFALLVHSANGLETVKLKAGTGGGLVVENGGASGSFKNLDIDESEDQVGAVGDVTLQGYYITNRAASERFIKFYEGTVSSVIVGTTVPKLTLPLAAAQSANLSQVNILFTGGLVIAATTGFADADVGAPGSNEVVGNFFLKA